MSDTSRPRYTVVPWFDVPAQSAPVGLQPRSGYWVMDRTSFTGVTHFDHRVDAQERADRWNRNAEKALAAEKSGGLT